MGLGTFPQLGGYDDDDLSARIARNPRAQSPLNLRGINPQPAAPAPTGNTAAGSPEETPPVVATSEPPPTLTKPTPQIPESPLQRQTEQDRTRQQELDKGSGITQIGRSHPIGGRILRGLNIAGEIGAAAVPAAYPLLQRIPGTEEHHRILENENQGALNTDEAQAEKEAATAHTTAETGAIPSTIAKNEAETKALSEPKPVGEKWSEFAGFTDTDGTPLLREEASGQVVRASDKKPPTGFKASKPEQPFQTREITRVVNGVPHTIMVDAQTGTDVKDEGQTKVPGESSADKRDAAQQAQVEREARVNIRKAEGQYRDTQKSVGQLKSGIDAAADGNGLLTSFVPTMEVLGINAANGVHRISPVEAQAAQLPGGWSERFNAWFDKATTGKISPELKTEGKALADILSKSAHERYKSTYQDENAIVEGYGGKGFNQRVPMIPDETAPGGQSGGVVVVNGFSFHDQAAADAYKKAAGGQSGGVVVVNGFSFHDQAAADAYKKAAGIP